MPPTLTTPATLLPSAEGATQVQATLGAPQEDQVAPPSVETQMAPFEAVNSFFPREEELIETTCPAGTPLVAQVRPQFVEQYTIEPDETSS